MKRTSRPNRSPATQGRAQTRDGFQNLALKLGEGASVMGGANYLNGALSWNRQRLEALYKSSWIVGQAVDVVADDMTRAGIDISGVDPEDVTKIDRAMTSLGVWQQTTSAIKWGRLYGGAIGFINIEGQKPDTPLRMDTIQKGAFLGLKVFDRWEANPDPTAKVLEGQDLGDPEFYSVPRLGLKIHHSRVLRFIGTELPWNLREQENGWGCSIVERLYDRIVPFDTATAGIAQLVTKAYLRTVKVDGLREILAQGGVAEENLIKMFALMGRIQSSEGITLLDKEDEFEAHSYTFSGLGDVLTQFAQQISGATGIPLVRLLGQSPAGLNATGEGDMNNYYDNIAQKQESSLRRQLLKVLGVMCRSVLGKEAPEELDFDFNPLKQTTMAEKTEAGKGMTDTVIAAYDAELIDKSVALRELLHVGAMTGMFSNITEEMIDRAEEEEEEARLNPPEPVVPGMVDPETGLPVPPTPPQPGVAPPALPGAPVPPAPVAKTVVPLKQVA